MYQIGLLAQSMKNQSSRTNHKEVHAAFHANLRISSGESINPTFVRVALTMWKVLQHKAVRNALLLGDELFGKNNPLSNSLYKLEALMQASGSDPVRFESILVFFFDLVLNGDIQPWECSWGPLTGKKQPHNKGNLRCRFKIVFFKPDDRLSFWGWA